MDVNQEIKNRASNMPVLSKKASNLVTTTSNSQASLVITSPSFDGEATLPFHISKLN